MRLLKKRALPSSPGELELRRGASDLGEGDSAALRDNFYHHRDKALAGTSHRKHKLTEIPQVNSNNNKHWGTSRLPALQPPSNASFDRVCQGESYQCRSLQFRCSMPEFGRAGLPLKSILSSVLFSSVLLVQSLSLVRLSVTPWTAAFLSITNSQSLLKLMSI